MSADFVGIQLTPQEQLQQIIDIAAHIERASGEVRRRFLNLVGGSRGLVDLERLTGLIESGRIEEAIAIADRIGPGLASSLEIAYAQAGQAMAQELSSEVDQVIDFNSMNERSVRLNQEMRARLVQEVTAGQRMMLTDTLADGVERGLRADQIAREMRDSIGLTSHQQRHVANYRRALEEGSANALSRELRDRRFDASARNNLRSLGADRIPLSQDKIDRMVGRYRERYIAHRAETISRTETQRQVNAADSEMWTQAIESGDVDPEDLESKWITARDERRRSSHAAMEGQSQPFGTAFRSGAGNDLRYPGDPQAPPSDTVNCRCVVSRRLKRRIRR